MASSLFSAAGDVGYIVGPIFGGIVASVTVTSQMFVVAPALIAALFLSAIFIARLK